jgi:hypothetical protein
MGLSMPSTKGASSTQPRAGISFGCGSILFFAVFISSACAGGARPPGTKSSSNAPLAMSPAQPGSNQSIASDADVAAPGEGESPNWVEQDAPARRIAQASGIVTCAKPRPRLCEATPSRVCAKRQRSGACESPPCEESVNVLNSCMACADPQVVSYVEGRCPNSSSH